MKHVLTRAAFRALILGSVIAALPAQAQEPAKAPAKASGDCAEAAVKAAAESLSSDDVRSLVGLPIGKEWEAAQEDPFDSDSNGGSATALVGAFRGPSCFELAVVDCPSNITPCFGSLTLFRLEGKALKKALAVDLDDQGGALIKTADFNHDGHQELLADWTIADTAGTETESGEVEFNNSDYAMLYQIKGDKMLTLWRGDDVLGKDVSFKDTNGDQIDELIVKKNGKEEIFFFDGTTFKTK